MNFPIPSVRGYLADLTFKKVDSYGENVPGAEFTLAHDTTECGFCRGDGKTSVSVENMVQTSGENGTVSFANIPSGHVYTLKETKVPAGYAANPNPYSVTVAYNEVTVTDSGGNVLNQDGTITITNTTSYALPATGGPGQLPYTMGGVLLTAAGILLLYIHAQRRKGDRSSS